MNAFLATPIPLDSNGIHSIFIWSGILIAILLLAFGGYGYLKRWMNPKDTSMGGAGFTLSDLRKLRDEGKLTAEEYEQARAKMVAAAKRMTETMPTMTPRRPGTGSASNPGNPPSPPG
jgi:hypothetical protein